MELKISPSDIKLSNKKFNLKTYLKYLDIKKELNKSNLRWVDMFCGNGTAINEFKGPCTYAIGISSYFSSKRIYNGNTLTLEINPKPNLITSFFGFYYLNPKEKLQNLLYWYYLLTPGGKISIAPYYSINHLTQESIDKIAIHALSKQKMINAKFNQIEYNLERLIIHKP